jgi:hypothetical protein
MASASSHERFQGAAESEGGMPVSAGARIAHVQSAVQAGRAYYVDLSRVPEDRRPELVNKINDLVNAANDKESRPGPRSAPGSTTKAS